MRRTFACPEIETNADPGALTLDGVYREHFRPVWRLLRRLGVAEAQLDDATQDVFLVVQRRLPEHDGAAPVRAWVFAIAVRVASEYRRRAIRWRAVPLGEERACAAPGPVRLTELQESIRLLHDVLEELDDERREAFVLSELEQLRAPEIASVLGVNLNTIYSRLRSARQRFEAALARRRAAATSRRMP
jgi:RNA polymerase sigma-70 factor (ECF subfamily)